MSAPASHTPGEWRVTRSSGLPSAVVAPHESLGSILIAKIVIANDHEANARLIAAAPDLISAVMGDVPEDPQLWRIAWLEGLLADCGKNGPFKAILEAGGGDDPDALRMAIEESFALVRDLRAALAKATGAA